MKNIVVSPLDPNSKPLFADYKNCPDRTQIIDLNALLWEVESPEGERHA